MSSLAVTSPTFALAGATGVTVTLTGVGTSWTSGTPGTPTFTCSQGTITAQTVASGTSATLTYSAPAGSEAEVFSDPSTSNTTSAFPILIPPSDANIYYSPACWHGGWAPTNGSYFKVGLLIPSLTTISLYFNTAALGSAQLWVRTAIDDLSATNANISGTSSLSLGTVSAATRQLQVFYRGRDFNDDWTATPPSEAFVVNGIYAPGCTTSAPTLFPGILIGYGDSKGEGCDALPGGGGNSVDYDGQVSFVGQIAYALGCEYGMRCYGGTGWTLGQGAIPPFFTPGNDARSFWNKLSAGQAAPVPTLGSGQAGYVVTFNLGANDAQVSASGASVTASVQGWLAAARAAYPKPWWLIVIPSFDGRYTTYVQTGVTNYLAANIDQYCACVVPNFPSWIQNCWLINNNQPNILSTEGEHPNVYGHGVIASWLTHLIDQVVQGNGVSGGSMIVRGQNLPVH